MCTLVIARDVPGLDGFFVVANRDEQLDRPAAEPSIIRRGDRRIVAPRDERAGGTWLGLNDAGLFAGLTNRFGLPGREEYRSRGQIVFDALDHRDVAAAVDELAEMEPDRHNGFHLVVADTDRARIVFSDTRQIRIRRLETGFHVVTERSFGAGESARLERMQRRLNGLQTWDDETRDRLEDWMVEHRDDPLESTCVHATAHDYGTRSSTIVETGARRRFAHADGPPCSTAYREYDDELEELFGP